MPEINIMGEQGLQEIIVEKVLEEKTEPEKSETPSKKKSSRIRVEEILAALISIGVILALVWYFYMKSHIRSEIEELTPRQYKDSVIKENQNAFDQELVTYKLIT